MKTSVKVLALLSALVVVFSATGVYAVWYYSEDGVNTVSVNVENHLMDFGLLPEGEDAEEEGKSHGALLEAILSHDDSYGLNYSKNVYKINMSATENELNSFENSISGGNMSKINSIDNLSFVIVCECDEDGNFLTFWLYSFTMTRYNDVVNGSKLEVYRTLIRQDSQTDEWGAVRSYAGYVVVDKTDETGTVYTEKYKGNDYVCIKPSAWVAGFV